MLFLDNYNKFMGQCFDTQKKALDMWQESFSPKDEKKESDTVNNMNNMVKKPMEMFNNWVGMMNGDMFTKNSMLFGQNPFQEVFEKMTNSTNTYSSLYGFWEDLTKQISGNSNDQVKKFFSKWQDEYMKSFSNTFISYLPEPTQSLFKQSMETYQMYFENSNKLFQPWTDHAKEFQKLMGTNIFEDKDAYINYAKLLGGNYEQTFGKLFGAPIMGINREYFEKQVGSVDSFMKYTNSINEFTATISRVGIETMEKISQDLQDMIKDETQPKTFKEFYEYWSRKNEEAYNNLFETDGFSKLLSQVVDAGGEFKKNYDKVLEQQLAFLPFPTKTDMNSMYKTIYELKKSVRNTTKELKEVKNRLNDKEKNA
ncbi:hypothetical protein IZY60_06595 [Lutibacter sp. B2]|nr:hypothetical protein [Lutibacter sp. B2]